MVAKPDTVRCHPERIESGPRKIAKFCGQPGSRFGILKNKSVLHTEHFMTWILTLRTTANARHRRLCLLRMTKTHCVFVFHNYSKKYSTVATTRTRLFICCDSGAFALSRGKIEITPWFALCILPTLLSLDFANSKAA